MKLLTKTYKHNYQKLRPLFFIIAGMTALSIAKADIPPKKDTAADKCSNCKPSTKSTKMRPPRPPHLGVRPGIKSLRPESQYTDQIHHFHKEIAGLYREGKAEAAQEVIQELREFIQDHAGKRRPARPPHHPEPAPDERRIHHLHQAAENLEQAGMHAESKRIHLQAERLEKELHEKRRDKGVDEQKIFRSMQSEIHQLNKKIDHLLTEMKSLKAELKNNKPR